jgi:hypothetical protein
MMVSNNGRASPTDLEKPKRIDFGLLSSPELFSADFSRPFLINGILAEGHHCVISGRFKSQKTHIAIAAAIALASGKPFLNRFDVIEPKRVAYFAGEGGPGQLQENARLMAGYQDVDGIELDDQLDWGTKVPKLTRREHVDTLFSLIKDFAWDVVFLDPVYLMISDSSEKVSNLSAMGGLLEELTDLGTRTDTTFVLVHHNRKGSNVDYSIPELEHITQSGFQEWAGQWMLTGHRARFWQDSTGRYSKLWLNVGGRSGHGGLYGLDIVEGPAGSPEWTAAVQTSAELKESDEKNRLFSQELKLAEAIRDKMEAVRQYLRIEPGNVTFERLARGTGSGPGSKAFGQAVEQLLESGELQRVTWTAGNNREARGFKAGDPDQ